MQFAGKWWNTYLRSKKEGRKHTAFPQINENCFIINSSHYC